MTRTAAVLGAGTIGLSWAALFAALANGAAQALLTGTDSEVFHPLRDLAEGLQAGDGQLRPDPHFAPATPVFSGQL